MSDGVHLASAVHIADDGNVQILLTRRINKNDRVSQADDKFYVTQQRLVGT